MWKRKKRRRLLEKKKRFKWIKLTIHSILYWMRNVYASNLVCFGQKQLIWLSLDFTAWPIMGFCFTLLHLVLPPACRLCFAELKWHLPNSLFIHQLINWCVNSMCSLFRDTNQFRWNDFFLSFALHLDDACFRLPCDLFPCHLNHVTNDRANDWEKVMWYYRWIDSIYIYNFMILLIYFLWLNLLCNWLHVN